VVNVQGDEPFMPAVAIQQVANTLIHRTEPMATLCTPLISAEAILNPNVVKVVFNQHQQALYFSRSPIPYGGAAYYRHIGLYAYRVSFLKQYVAWGPCELEVQEKLEQLRALWHNIPIVVPIAQEAPLGDINTPEDLAGARHISNRCC
jgi:3-deoxy-manno-octulosonate cytidylyltransferase (CMP-KDO synthetase)